MSDDALARSFGAESSRYDRGRPDYPAESVAWMLEQLDPGSTVADVGAGTGKLTRVVHGLGHRVVAVDPDVAMLEQLRTTTPDVHTSVGTGEQLPFEDASVDAVVFGQAWHWVDPGAASAEIGRVLRPGGTLGLIWNIRDRRAPWVEAMSAIMKPSRAEELIAEGGPPVAAPFPAPEEHRVEWTRAMTAEGLRDMAFSRSYVITADAERRAAIDDELQALFAALPELVDGGAIEHPYTTHAFRTQR